MSQFKDQAKFMSLCEQTVDVLNEEQFKLYLTLITEEYGELLEAVKAGDRVETLDALLDIVVVASGALNSLGVDTEGAWKEVMASNFAKVDPVSGRLVRREDGKILKPDNWRAPELRKYIL